MFSLKKKKKDFQATVVYVMAAYFLCIVTQSWISVCFLLQTIPLWNCYFSLFATMFFSLIQLPYYQARRFWRPLLEKSFYYRRPQARSYMHIRIHTCIYSKSQVIKWLLRRILMNDSQPIRRLIMNSDHHGNWLNQ